MTENGKFDSKSYLDMELLRFTTAGSVDDGKSTLIGRLLYDSKSIFEEVDQYLDKNNVPFNPLHRKGFVSIGCAPCTRAIAEGEDIRAGRWWWEDSKKECGLHEQPINYQI